MNTLALDMGGTSIKAALVDADHNLHEFQEIPSHASRGGKVFLSTALALCKMYHGYGKIGISVTGQTKDGVIVFANENVPHFTGMKIRELFEKELKVPVAVENDVNAAAVGEMVLGAGKNWRDMICLTYGTGIGGTLIMDGKLYRGRLGGAGEAGHIVVHPEGLPCACGLSGCYEQYASVNALIREAGRLEADCASGRDVFLYAGKNEKMRQIVSAWIDEICYGLTTLVHVFQPEGVILGGGIMEVEGLTKTIAERMAGRVMGSHAQTRFVKAQLGNRAGLLGAALFVDREQNGEKM